MKQLTPAERLIVAADFMPTTSGGIAEVVQRIDSLAVSLRGTGVCIKVNSALRAYGYEMIERIKMQGVKVFADLKLYDIPETLRIDAAFLRLFEPEFLTVACVAGIEAMTAVRLLLPNTEVLGVTVLTSLAENETKAMFACSTEEAVSRLAKMADIAVVGGLIASAAEAEMLRRDFGVLMTINTPAIRPGWAIVSGDDQDPTRIMTPAKAILAGADRIVVGRPITQNVDPHDAVMRTIEEIATVAP